MQTTISGFLNTAIIMLLIDSNIFGFKIQYDVLTYGRVNVGDSRTVVYMGDTNREWYVTIGTKIIDTWITIMFMPHLVDAITAPF